MKQEDVTILLIQLIRNLPAADPLYQPSAYGYDVYLPSLVKLHFNRGSSSVGASAAKQNRWEELSPLFYNAAWELCRRGIIRPWVKTANSQATPDGNAGNGYSITPFGRQWLDEINHQDFVPTEPERFSQMISPYSTKFGKGFHQRSQEAVRCYGAHAYLACCAMCGAAAESIESILLAAAIAKRGDETQVLKEYCQTSGRSKIENILLGQADKRIKEEFSSCHSLLRYWRDESAHGRASHLEENEAYTALAMLLRFAMYVNNSWNNLTAVASE